MAVGQAAPKCEELVHKALETYGCLESLRNFPLQIQQQAGAQLANDSSITEDEKAQVMDAVMKSIDVGRLIRNVESEMVQKCNADEYREVIATLNTPATQKMIHLEATPDSPESMEKMEKLLSSGELQKAPAKRAEAVRRLMEATGAANATVETVVQTSRAMMEGLGAPPASDEKIRELREQVEGTMSENLYLMMLAVYNDASDEDLENYVAMVETKPFRAFNSSFTSAMVNGVALESRHAGEALKSLAQKKRAQHAAEDGKH